jgi:uncharacterized membrane protein YheB (UPF0754 family)
MAAQKPKKPISTTTSPSLGKFVDRLIEEKKFPQNLNKEFLEKIKKELLEMLNKTINAKILAQLTPEQLKEFKKMLEEKESSEKTQVYAKSKIPNFEVFLAGILLDFRKKYLGLS